MTLLSTSEISFKDLRIVHVCKPKLKNTYISVSKNGDITLKSPRVSNEFILALLEEKEAWIKKQLKISSENQPVMVNLEDEILLFSEIHSIDIDEAKRLRNYLNKLRVASEKNILKCYDRFYKEYANEYIYPRVNYFSQLMNLDFKEIKFKKMKSRWGSCSSDKILTFNTQLIKIDKQLIDYVIVHELSHLVHMNHSQKFHDLVNKYIINSKELRKKLKTIHLL